MVWSSLRYSTADILSYTARSTNFLLSKKMRTAMGFKDDISGYASIHVDPSTGSRYLIPDPRNRDVASDSDEGTNS